uniref:Uncharacterized protein n=1 Tax=Anguilla anguilla TaxID=7936 RepID=A0A0E9TCE0_ANGAN
MLHHGSSCKYDAFSDDVKRQGVNTRGGDFQLFHRSTDRIYCSMFSIPKSIHIMDHQTLVAYPSLSIMC